MKKLIFILLTMISMVSMSSPKDIEDGYQYQTQKNNQKLMAAKPKLDKFFDFEGLSQDGILPPVVICDEKLYFTKCKIIEPSRSIYKNSNQDKLTWQDFLIIDIPENHIVVADNPDFQSGVNKALRLLDENYAKIESVYIGMLQYKSLGIANLNN